MKPENIRNFCIIAHIDHGKSTLADRLLEATSTLTARQMKEQVLDQMDLERERGITIKLQAVRLNYRAGDGQEYILNLIDTPGHVDFTYEVSRSLAACEGAILVVDAVQGIEAQTLANTYLALEQNLAIVPVINKIDLASADPERVEGELVDLIGGDAKETLLVSAKQGTGIAEVLEAIVNKVPPPVASDPDRPLKALVFDSNYDKYRGVIAYIRVMEGSIKKDDRIKFMNTGKVFEVAETGVFRPAMEPVSSLSAGEVGYLMASIKNVEDAAVGDTVTRAENGAEKALPGYRQVVSMVFCGLFPQDSNDFVTLREAIERLKLNDSALSYEPEKSTALGLGFRCGFLGLLHMEVVQERLRREFDLDIISTHPAVVYKIEKNDGTVMEIDNPVLLPEVNHITKIEEPVIKATIISPSSCIGDIMRIVLERRGEMVGTESLDATRVILTCHIPLNEILIDFHDMLKSVSHGYASMDYEPYGYQVSDIVKMDILLNGEVVDAFSCMVHRDKVVGHGRKICKALADSIPPHMFKIPVQAVIGRNIIAREDIRPFRKDVTAKLYGGDVTRKQKLLKKQKEGKKRMKEFGQVNVPQSAFIAVLKGKATND